MRYKKPFKATEAEVQAEFYRRCRNAGIEIHLEYYADKSCRLDAVIVRGDTIVAIIECKRRRSPRQSERVPARDEDQRIRYGGFGVPIIWVCGFEEIERGFADVRRIIAARSGNGWRNERRTVDPPALRSIGVRDD